MWASLYFQQNFSLNKCYNLTRKWITVCKEHLKQNWNSCAIFLPTNLYYLHSKLTINLHLQHTVCQFFYFISFILSRSNFLKISWLIRYMKKITQFWLVKINAVLGNSMQKRVDSVQRSNKQVTNQNNPLFSLSQVTGWLKNFRFRMTFLYKQWCHYVGWQAA